MHLPVGIYTDIRCAGFPTPTLSSTVVWANSAVEGKRMLSLAAALLLLSTTALAANPPSWPYVSWDDHLPVFIYGSNCTGYDSPQQLEFNGKFDLEILIFAVNQGRKDCGSSKGGHSEVGLTQRILMYTNPCSVATPRETGTVILETLRL